VTVTIKVGCEAYIVRDGKLLLGRRKNVFGHGTWALPGGHLEPLERADECIAREIHEELGITIAPATAQLVAVTDGLYPERDAHYIHLTFRVDIGPQEPKLAEPDRCSEWRWCDPAALPIPLFAPHAAILATIASGHTYRFLLE